MAGVPLNKPVPASKVTPVGKGPLQLRIGVGDPAAVTVMRPLLLTVKVALAALMNDGAAWRGGELLLCSPPSQAASCTTATVMTDQQKIRLLLISKSSQIGGAQSAPLRPFSHPSHARVSSSSAAAHQSTHPFKPSYCPPRTGQSK